MYAFNDIPLRSIGVIPCLGKQRIALEGVFDFPRRKGTSEHNWGTGIEPFTDAADIEFDGRTLTMNAWLRGESPEQYAAVLEAFKTACLDCRKISTGYADFDVLLKDEVRITEYIGHNRARATAAFWQQTVEFPALEITPSGGEGYLLDGFSLREDFGVRVVERQGNNSIGKRIEVDTTLPYTRTEYRDPASATLRCYMRGTNFVDMYARMTRLHALCAAPGLHTVRYPNGEEVAGYFKEGFTVKAVHRTKLDFDLKLRVI